MRCCKAGSRRTEGPKWNGVCQSGYNHFDVTTMPRTRKTVVVLCIAVVVFAAFAPTAASTVGAVVLTPLWLVIPAVIITVVKRTAVRCHEQPVALLSLVLLRAPPANSSR